MIDEPTRRRAEFRRLIATFDERQLAALVAVMQHVRDARDPGPIIIDMLGEEAAAPIIAEFAANQARRA